MVELAELHPDESSPNRHECQKADGDAGEIGVKNPDGGLLSVLGHRGEGVWVPMCLKNRTVDKIERYEKIRITAEWERTQESHCVRRLGQVGIWLPVNDTSTNHEGEGEAHQVAPLGSTYNAKVLQTSWDAGAKATIDLASPAGNYEGIPIHFHCVPVWNLNEDGCSDAVLRIQTHGQKKGSPKFVQLGELNLTFDQVESTQRDDGFIFTMLKSLDALQNSGLGNSVHPKQLITIKQLRKCLKSRIEEGRDKIKIAYIGSDTTENLRSVIRYLDASEEGNHVSNFQVFMTPDWDKEKLERLGDTYSLDQCQYKGKKIEPHTLPSIGEMPSIEVEADIVIATYVTPWATSGFEQGAQYRHLLDKLLGNESVLITTDPKTSNRSVRSRLGEHYNSTTLLTGYGLKPDDNMVTSHPMVSSKLWRRANG